MPPKNPAQQLLTMPLAEVLTLLLRQFRRPLAAQGFSLTMDEEQALATAIATGEDHPKQVALIAAMRAVVDESLALLQTRWGFSFARSLASDMSAIGGWETTAEFIEIANEKSNAELRISGGSTVLVFAGEVAYAPYLLDVIEADNGAGDVDAVLAQRALCHAANVALDDTAWLAKVQQWMHNQES